MRQARNYAASHATQQQVDEQQNAAANQEYVRPYRVLRTWTPYGGMVPHQESANEWIRQNNEIRQMAQTGRAGNSPGGQQNESSQTDHQQDQAGLQEARAAVEEARQREAAEMARQQERQRGMER